MINALKTQVKEFPSVESNAEDPGFGERLSKLSGKAFVRFNASPSALKFASSAEAAAPIMKPFTPDQIVYCGPRVQFVACQACLKEVTANVVIVKGAGVYALGDTEKNANNCMTLVKDAMKVATYAEAFGGARPMAQELVDFIVGWEVESYRKSVK